MTEVLAKVNLASISGLPEDGVNMDLSFDAANLLPATLDGIAASIASFFNTANTSNKICEYMGDQVSRAANSASVDFYDVSAHLDGSAAGSPSYTKQWTLGANITSANYPSEVAMRVNFMADGWEDVPETAIIPGTPPTKTRPRARYRGGFFIGPLSDNCATGGSTTEPRPNSNFINDLAVAADRFMDERGGDFCVWSRTDEVFRPVAPGGVWFTDNAFDTIRKRGFAATARTQLWP